MTSVEGSDKVLIAGDCSGGAVVIESGGSVLVSLDAPFVESGAMVFFS